MTESFVDIACLQEPQHNQLVSGDSFLSQYDQDENRRILVLSDGLGSGIKASVLATLTTTMAARFTTDYKDLQQTAEIIMRTLPVCKQRKINYATFTIIDIGHDLMTRVIEYDNPRVLLLRGRKFFEPAQATIQLKSKNQALASFNIQAQNGDRLIAFSDGISQSGLGTRSWPEGWKSEGVKDFILKRLSAEPELSARGLAREIVKAAHKNDLWEAKDDLSCCVVSFRQPKKLLLVSGPPQNPELDNELARLVDDFEGQTIIAGGTTASLIARELKRDLHLLPSPPGSGLPPLSRIEGIDLVSEGILTLSRVESLLAESLPLDEQSSHPARALLELLLASDQIKFVIGSRVNDHYFKPGLATALGLRPDLIKKIARRLKEDYFKQIELIYF